MLLFLSSGSCVSRIIKSPTKIQKAFGADVFRLTVLRLRVLWLSAERDPAVLDENGGVACQIATAQVNSSFQSECEHFDFETKPLRSILKSVQL